MLNFGAMSSTTPLRHVQLIPPNVHPPEAHRSAGWLEHDRNAVKKQFNEFVRLLESAKVTVSITEPAPVENPDAIYAYDNAIVLPDGAIVYRSCKPNRVQEWKKTISDIQSLGIPILGVISPPGSIDGGDVFWLGRNELAAGLSWRTNCAGLDQLERLLQPHDVRLFRYDLPNVGGPTQCLHLMSLISPLNENCMVIEERYLPVRLIKDLKDRNVLLIIAEPNEFDLLATNILSLGNNRLIGLKGSPVTQSRITAAGFDIQLLNAPDLCVAGTGGPTCLTRILCRDEGVTVVS